MNVFLRVLPYLRRYPLVASGTFLCAVAATLLVVVFPTVTQRIVDEVLRGNQPGKLLPYVGIGLAAFVAQNLLDSLRIQLNNRFEQAVIFDLRSDLYQHIQTLPLRWFDQRATGDIMTRLVEDVTSVERVLIDGIEQGSVAILQILVVSGLMLVYSAPLTFVALAPIPLLATGALIYTITARSRYRKQRQAASALNSLLHDNLAGIRQIKTYVSEEPEHQRFNAASTELRKTTLTVMSAWAFYNPAMQLITSVGTLLVTGVGATWVMQGNLDLGKMVAFLVLTQFLYEPVGRLHQLNQLFQAGRAAGERVFEIMDTSSEPGKTSGAAPQQVEGDVRFENVSFSHTGEQPTLQDITLHARPGEMVALVGPTGAGKTSLVNLLVRFYEFDSGEILIDGRPLRSFAKDELRRAVAVVTQESFLFNGNTAENLRVGKLDASEDEMWAALEASNAADFVRRMPEGLYTPVGERGVKLSVGEKQRISIARALLKNPPILVLDEATASVDTATERMIQTALDRLMEHRTSFVIAHRLSTVRHADQIIVLERGQIVEQGRHDELLSKGGLYAHLCHISLMA